MTEEPDSEIAGALRRLRAQLGACPKAEDLIAFERNELDGENRRTVEAHLELCAVCQGLVERLRQPEPQPDDFTWKRAERALDQRAAPWRPRQPLWRRYPGLVAAAVMVAIAPALWLWMGERDISMVDRTAVRGTAIQLLEPAGRVDRLDRFRWNALPAHAGFRVTIMSGQTLIREATTSETRYTPDDALKRRLGSAGSYRWKVAGLDDRGQVLDESAWMTFELAP